MVNISFTYLFTTKGKYRKSVILQGFSGIGNGGMFTFKSLLIFAGIPIVVPLYSYNQKSKLHILHPYSIKISKNHHITFGILIRTKSNKNQFNLQIQTPPISVQNYPTITKNFPSPLSKPNKNLTKLRTPIQSTQEQAKTQSPARHQQDLS